MGNLGYGFNVNQVGIGVAYGFNVNGLSIILDRSFKALNALGRIHKGGGNAEIGEGMFEQVIGTAVNGGGTDNVLACMDQCLHGVGNGCCTAGRGQGSYAAFQGCNAFFKNIFGGVGQPAVNVTRIFQGKTVSRMLGVPEYIRCSLVNRHRPGIRSGICLFLAYMQLESLKMVLLLFTHCLCLP